MTGGVTSLGESIFTAGQHAALLEWNNKVMEMVNNNSNNSHATESSSLKKPFLKHDHFVVSPIDKANENAAFICKCLYIETLKKELEIGLDGVPSNSGHK